MPKNLAKGAIDKREMRLAREWVDERSLFSRKAIVSAKLKEKPRLGWKRRLRPKMRKSKRKNRGEDRLPVERMRMRVIRVMMILFVVLRYIWIGLLDDVLRLRRS